MDNTSKFNDEGNSEISNEQLKDFLEADKLESAKNSAHKIIELAQIQNGKTQAEKPVSDPDSKGPEQSGYTIDGGL